MKRRILLLVLALTCIAALTGCKCKHEWVAADCVTPKTCSLCWETEGAALGHDWLAATCEEAKMCKVCSAVEGMAAGHSWVDATCMDPKHCEACGLEEGELRAHTWLNATTESPKICSVCSVTEGERIVTDERFETEKCRALFGSWKYQWTMPAEDMKLESYVEEVPYTAVLTFTEDGQITMELTLTDAKQFKQNLYEGTVDAIYRQFETMEMSQEESDAAFQESYGMSVEEYCTAMWADVNWNGFLDLHEREYVYYVDGNKLHIADNWDAPFMSVAYSVSEDGMTLADSVFASDTILELRKLQ